MKKVPCLPMRIKNNKTLIKRLVSIGALAHALAFLVYDWFDAFYDADELRNTAKSYRVAKRKNIFLIC